MPSTVLLALCSWICAPPEGGPDFIDPLECRSPSGNYALYMDPSEPFGDGPAKYTVQLRDEPQWTVELPFTLRELAVTDAGYCLGYGFTGRGGIDSEFVVAILDPRGELIFDERTKRSRSMAVHGHMNPHVFDLIVDAERDRFSIRLAHQDQFRGAETWWRYAISAAKRLDDLRPQPPLERDESMRFHIEHARLLPGTALHLLHWSSSDWSVFNSGGGIRYGSAFTLTRPDGSVAWRRLLPSEHEVEGDEATSDAPLAHARRVGAILDVDRANSFTLWFARDAQAVSFEAREAPEVEGRWEVHEVARRPYALPPDPKRVELPRLDLLPLSSQRLESEQLGSSLGLDTSRAELAVTRIQSPGWCTFVGGRIAVQDKRTAALYVWGENGALELYCRAKPEDARHVNSVARITSAPDGSWWVEAEGDRGYLGWDATGARLGYRKFDGHPVFAPGSRLLWTWGGELGLAKRDLAGVRLSTITRRPDRRWMQYVCAAACLTDGSVAVLGYEDVLLYSPQGEPLEVLPLPRRARRIEVSGDWMLFSAWDRGATLVARSNGTAYAFGGPGDPEHGASAFGLSNDGRRLLTVHKEGESLELRRFTLP